LEKETHVPLADIMKAENKLKNLNTFGINKGIFS